MTHTFILSDSARGIYCPQHTAETIQGIPNYLAAIRGINAEDLDILAQGPNDDNDEYWDAWTSVTDGGSFILLGKGQYTIHQSEHGDVWAIHEDELDEFFNDDEQA
jgi:hypothetical protein